jgi:hypothetical protein
MLLKDSRVNFSANDDISRVDPSVDNNYPNTNHKKIVEVLLKDDRIDPSADDNWAIHASQRRKTLHK